MKRIAQNLPSNSENVPPKMKRNNLNSNESDYKIHLLDLPPEILEKIIAYIPMWHRKRARSYCRQLQTICDNLLKHEYLTSKYYYSQHKDQHIYEYAVLKVLHQATWAYVKSNHCPWFYGSTLTLFRCNYNNPFGPSIEHIQFYLLNFYRIVEESFGDPYTNTSKMLFLLTLLSFLTAKENEKDTEWCISEKRSDYIRFEFTLHFTWLGILWSEDNVKSFVYPDDNNTLLIILVEMMIARITNKTFRKTWQYDKKIFVFGKDEINWKKSRHSKLIFDVEIHGSTAILNFIETVSQTRVWQSMPNDEFWCDIHILCREAVKWGCWEKSNIGFGEQI